MTVLARALRNVPAAIIIAAGNFLVIALQARLLPSEQFGLFVTCMAAVTIVGSSCGQWVAQPLIREVSRTNRLSVSPKVLFRSVGGAAVLAGLVSGALVAAMTVGDSRSSLLWVAAGVAGGSQAVLTAVQAIPQGLRLTRVYTVFQFMVMAVRTGGAGVAVIYRPEAAAALLAVAASSASLGYLVVGLRRSALVPIAEKTPDLSASSLLQEGAPFLVWSLISTAVSVGDRLILPLYMPFSAVGAYALQYSIAVGIAFLFGTPILIYLQPAVMRLVQQGAFGQAADEMRRGYVALVVGAAFAVGLALLAGARSIRLLFEASLQPGDYVLPLLCAATFLWQAALICQKPLEAQAHSAPLLAAITSALASNFGLLLVLVPSQGLLGAASASFCAYGAYLQIVLAARGTRVTAMIGVTAILSGVASFVGAAMTGSFAVAVRVSIACGVALAASLGIAAVARLWWRQHSPILR